MPRTTLLLTRNEAAQLSGASPAAVNKAIEQGVVTTRTVERSSLIDARDVGALWLFSELRFGLPIKDKRRLSRWLRDAQPGAETALGTALIVRKTEEIDATIKAALRYVKLKQRFLEINPDRQGGEPVVRGTRIPIRGLARQIEAGESHEVLRQEYDYVSEDAFEFAVQWAKANPRRGRPVKRRAASEQKEPKGRHVYIERRRQAQSNAAA